MKINFHILEKSNLQQAWLYLCQLIEQAYSEQQSVYIYTNSNQESEKIDALLWTYKDDSFIPHQIADPASPSNISIQISHLPPQIKAKLLINLSSQLPAFYKEFEQMIEIVFSDASMQQLARERYKHYRDNGDELNTIKN